MGYQSAPPLAAPSLVPNKVIFRTGNIMGSGYSAGLFRKKPNLENSCAELINSLRENLRVASEAAKEGRDRENGGRNGNNATDKKLFKVVQGENADVVMHVPGRLYDYSGDGSDECKRDGLKDNREDYDITVKLFYVSGIPPTLRPSFTEEAISLVLETLETTYINLLIVSFPNIHFNADDEGNDDGEDEASNFTTPTTITTPATSSSDKGVTKIDEETLSILSTYRTIESFSNRKVVSKIGLSEFGTLRLGRLLPCVSVKPSVDQINVRDCCVVPRQLIMYAKKQGIELLTHNDCADILPREILQEVVDEFNLFGHWEGGKEEETQKKEDVKISGSGDAGRKEDAKFQYQVMPQWVIKYTAVVRDRGVVENKGYIAMANVTAR